LLARASSWNEHSFLIAGGIILFFVTLALIGPALRLFKQIMEALRQVEERPRPALAFAMLCLGTLCTVSAMLIQLNAGAQPAPTFTMTETGFTAGSRVSVAPPASLGLGILTTLTFLLGANLIGLGVWASLKPGIPPTASITKPEAPELQEVVG
jgi:hypothetical protein